MKNITRLLIGMAFLGAISLSSCVTVKPYQKVYLNDEDMMLGAGSLVNFEQSFHSYREGASGANGGKVGGGCGCN